MLESLDVTDVCRAVPGIYTVAPELIKETAGLHRKVGGSAQEQQILGSVVDEVLCDGSAETAETTGKDVCAVVDA